MALLVPDESLASVQEANNYHDARGNSGKWEMLDTPSKEQYLRQAFDFLFAVYGLRWPEGRPFGTLEGGAVPIPMRNAACILALKAKAGPLMPDATPQKIESTVGPITSKFAAATIGPEQRYPEVHLLVKAYLPMRTGSSLNAPIVRN